MFWTDGGTVKLFKKNSGLPFKTDFSQVTVTLCTRSLANTFTRERSHRFADPPRRKVSVDIWNVGHLYFFQKKFFEKLFVPNGMICKKKLGKKICPLDQSTDTYNIFHCLKKVPVDVCNIGDLYFFQKNFEKLFVPNGMICKENSKKKFCPLDQSTDT